MKNEEAVKAALLDMGNDLYQLADNGMVELIGNVMNDFMYLLTSQDQRGAMEFGMSAYVLHRLYEKAKKVDAAARTEVIESKMNE